MTTTTTTTTTNTTKNKSTNQDEALDQFLYLSGCAETGRLPRHIEENRFEQEMRKSVENLANANPERLVHFLPLIFDKLLLLLVRPPSVGGHTLKLNASLFEILGRLVRKLRELKESQTDKHGRCALITSYIQYRVSIPHADAGNAGAGGENGAGGNGGGGMTSSSSMTPVASFAGVSTGGGFVRPTARPPLPPGAVAGGGGGGGESSAPHVFGRSNSNPDIMPPPTPLSPAGMSSYLLVLI